MTIKTNKLADIFLNGMELKHKCITTELSWCEGRVCAIKQVWSQMSFDWGDLTRPQFWSEMLTRPQFWSEMLTRPQFWLRCSQYFNFELIRSEITKKEKNKYEKDDLFLIMVDRIRGKGVADMQILARASHYICRYADIHIEIQIYKYKYKYMQIFTQIIYVDEM